MVSGRSDKLDKPLEAFKSHFGFTVKNNDVRLMVVDKNNTRALCHKKAREWKYMEYGYSCFTYNVWQFYC